VIKSLEHELLDELINITTLKLEDIVFQDNQNKPRNISKYK